MFTCQKVVRVLVLLALLLSPLPQASVPTPPVAPPEATASDTVTLPLDAQASISTVIGRDDASYHLLPQSPDEIGEGYEATNEAQNLQAHFTNESALLQSGNQHWDMRLQAWGRGQDLSFLEGAILQASANRVEYAYAGLTEWYVNGPYGLQQGFTLAAPPAALISQEPLVLSLNLGDYRAQLDADGKGATLSTPDGAASLRYAGLLAYDAAGRALSTWLELNDRSGSSLNIRVADAGARYPITVDPLVQQAKLISSDGAGDNFGFSVALSNDGNTALIGAYAADVLTKTNQGAAYVFTRSNYDWNLQAKLTADLGTIDGKANDRFGISVALSDNGNTALIGADQVDVSGHVDQGTAYVLTRSGSTWTPQAMLIPTEGEADDQIGWSVALSGDGNTALVSAHRADVAGRTDNGAAYVFVRSGAAWTEQDRLEVNVIDGTYVGYSVALSQDGNTALLGAMGYDQVGDVDEGGAFVFTRSNTTWSYEDSLLLQDGMAGDLLGRSVALSDDGNTALIGASGATVNGKDNQGAAYIFARSNHNWTLQTRLTADDGAAGDYFGVSVVLMGNGYVAFVGAYQANVNGHTDQGAVYSFVPSGSNWTQWTQASKLTGSQANQEYGVSVALAGATLLVGARGTTVNDNADQGAAYFLMPEGSGTRTVRVSGSGNANDRFGISVALNDSGTTALVSAYLADVDGKIDQGAAYVFGFAAGSWIPIGKLVASDGAAEDRFGWSVALSGDGSTALVGAYQADATGLADSGAAYVFTRSFATGDWSQQAKLAFPITGDNLGYSVALSENGNVALCGALHHKEGANTDQGLAVIFTRSGSTWSSAGTLLADDGKADDLLGRSVALSSDGNTALVGASKADIGLDSDQGAAYVFVKSGANWTQQKKLVFADGEENDSFGISVALSDDGNKALVGAHQGNGGRGEAVLFNRSGTTWSAGEALSAVGVAVGDRYGVSVALSGDGNLALVGADQSTVSGKANQGAVYVFKYVYVPPYLLMWVVQPKLTSTDGVQNDYFGFSVAASEDGETVLVGAYGVNVGPYNAQGAAYPFIFRNLVFLPAIQR
ncbi:hypothetical protein TFLX_02519 [Thermoflexales bacterium]|nr:hypothetical protein TFLX_02519 [Thermoflexales bacterium]